MLFSSRAIPFFDIGSGRPFMRNSDDEPVYAETNVGKYQDANPVTSRLVQRFMSRCVEEIGKHTAAGARLLDVGVSEGTMTSFVARRLPSRTFYACEFEAEGSAAFHGSYPDLPLARASAYQLPFESATFDLVTAFEVLEHLQDPREALLEMKRVSQGRVTVTVPHEPFFRLGNVARGKHLASWGNTPGHINHWRLGTLRTLMRSVFASVDVLTLFPWLLATGNSEPTSQRTA
jgi:SAM-dependent methyltransferase